VVRAIALFFHYDAISPTLPNPAVGATYSFNNPGHATYFTADVKRGAAVWFCD
jgi:hypothetical protein